MMVVTHRSFDVDGGSLLIKLQTDHILVDSERDALERVAAECRRFEQSRPPSMPVDEIDVAIELLGGEENICAG